MTITTNAIILPPPSSPFTTEDNKIERDWYLCLRQIISSIGGFSNTTVSNSDLQQLTDENLDIATADLPVINSRLTDLETEVSDWDLQNIPSIQDVADSLNLAYAALDDAIFYPALSLAASAFANPTALVGLTAVNGAASTAMRSDASPPIDTSISPTWTGNHTHTPTSGVGVTINAATGSQGWVVNQASGTAGGLIKAAATFPALFNIAGNGNAAAAGFIMSQDATSAGIFNNLSAQPIRFKINTVFYWDLGITGGLYADSATGADKGLGTVNSTGYFVNGVPIGGSLIASKPSDTTSGNATLTADAALTTASLAVGTYTFELFLAFYEVVLGTGGFQFDLNAGSATIGAIVYGLTGFATASLANAAATSITTVQSSATIATAAASPSWYLAKGQFTVTVAGTFGVRWAQNTLSVNLTTLKALSYLQPTRVA